MIYRNSSLEFGRFIHCGFRNPVPLAAIWAVSLMIYDFLYKNVNFLYENLRFSLWYILMIFAMIFWAIHKIS